MNKKGSKKIRNMNKKIIIILALFLVSLATVVSCAKPEKYESKSNQVATVQEGQMTVKERVYQHIEVITSFDKRGGEISDAHEKGLMTDQEYDKEMEKLLDEINKYYEKVTPSSMEKHIKTAMEKEPKEPLTYEEVMSIKMKVNEIDKAVNPLMNRQNDLYDAYDKGTITKEELHKGLKDIEKEVKEINEKSLPLSRRITSYFLVEEPLFGELKSKKELVGAIKDTYKSNPQNILGYVPAK